MQRCMISAFIFQILIVFITYKRLYNINETSQFMNRMNRNQTCVDVLVGSEQTFLFQVLGQYIENLMAASSVFQPANGDPHPAPSRPIAKKK